MIVGLPMPFASAQAAIFGIASSAGRPSNAPLFTTFPGPTYAVASVSPSSFSPSGWMTTRTGRSYLRANSKSRSSCAGTDMIAPVP